jgi:hypothetical protein
VKTAQPIPLALGTAVAALIVGLPGDPEEAASIGDRVKFLDLAKPVQPLPNDLFPDKVYHE